MFALLGLALAAASAGYQAYMGYRSASYANAVSKYRKRVAINQAVLRKLQAKEALLTGETRAMQRGSQAMQAIGSQRAAYGASGVRVGVGSAAKVIQGTTQLGRGAVSATRRAAALRAWGYDVGAAEASAQAKLYGFQRVNPWLSTVGPLLDAAGFVVGMQNPYKVPRRRK